MTGISKSYRESDRGDYLRRKRERGNEKQSQQTRNVMTTNFYLPFYLFSLFFSFFCCVSLQPLKDVSLRDSLLVLRDIQQNREATVKALREKAKEKRIKSAREKGLKYDEAEAVELPQLSSRLSESELLREVQLLRSASLIAEPETAAAKKSRALVFNDLSGAFVSGDILWRDRVRVARVLSALSAIVEALVLAVLGVVPSLVLWESAFSIF